MDTKCEVLCDSLAKRVVEKNFAEAHALLAPWLQARMTPSDLESLVNRAGHGLGPAHAWTLDEGFLEVQDLGDAPTEITGQNYRGWLCIQFNPGEVAADDPNAAFDLWLAAVEYDGDYRVGHIEAAESD
ncbi:MAG TPA: hypothetical protein VFH88_10135 [Candidatus Krumholzibacteria bacterium]|nr:hypothetical protein [Candidatus Krumholzibacteria bacterium]